MICEDLRREELEQILLGLVAKNYERMSHCKKRQLGLAADAVKYVFILCENFEQDMEVKYQAISLFEKFTTAYIMKQHDMILEQSQGGEQDIDLLLHQAAEKTKQEYVFYAIACVLLASKFHTHCHISPQAIEDFMEAIHHKVPFEQIKCKELEILQLLKFNVNLETPLKYISCLIEILSFDDPSVSKENLSEISFEVLHHVYCHRNEVYANFYHRLTGKRQVILPEEHELMNKIKSDFFLLACGIIAAASGNGTPESAEKMLERLSDLCQIPVSSIATLAYLILNIQET